MAPTEKKANTKADTTTGEPTGRSAASQRSATDSPLEAEQGQTAIADGVVAKVAGIAAREVPGVYDMGAVPARAMGTVIQRAGISDQWTQGVSVEVGERQAAADLTVVIDYGESVPRVAEEVRANVIRRVEGITGLEVTEVNISVDDIYVPGDEREEPGEPRVE
ncbi:MAG: Asp23/Gls24 family envelope stress response protein [Solirubrobacterales bacterium]